MADKKSHFGAAGQLAAMSEFLLLGYNVAIPQVDVGEDVLVVDDRQGDLRRVQVKTADARGKSTPAYRLAFGFPRAQLIAPAKKVVLILHADDAEGPGVGLSLRAPADLEGDLRKRNEERGGAEGHAATRGRRERCRRLGRIAQDVPERVGRGDLATNRGRARRELREARGEGEAAAPLEDATLNDR
jgi:hypothetical protein